ncbi:hypothetical protein OPV22_032443 [Ensete ventricosum]|uniref:Uncharacterized protein n=1 Tax=Ensete ventricosum TaxID=4639 RepID=A0AAV8PVF5_ENSVE|nr:hypothetical protein OPV22_032443 [Ensete ventricosum]
MFLGCSPSRHGDFQFHFHIRVATNLAAALDPFPPLSLSRQQRLILNHWLLCPRPSWRSPNFCSSPRGQISALHRPTLLLRPSPPDAAPKSAASQPRD